MVDEAHDWTDEQIAALESRMSAAYEQAVAEMNGKLSQFLADFDKRNEEMKSRLASGKVTQDEYDRWLEFQSTRQVWLGKMAEELATDATRVDQIAMDYINDELPNVYCENVNYSFYGIEKEIGFDTHSFTLYDQKTVALLLADPDAVRYPKANLDETKDSVWNFRKINEALTQSILQGESIPNTAKRIRSVVDMDRRVSTRVARTTMTSAENAGRVESYRVADKAGVKVQKEWMATIDVRTRQSHRLMNGVHVPYDKPFIVGPNEAKMMHPADPQGPADETMNCRCTLVGWVEGIEAEDPEQWTNLPEGMTYEQWLGAKQNDQGKQRQEEEKDESAPTIAGVKKGKPMTFEKANELRGNPRRHIDSKAQDDYMEKTRAKEAAFRRYLDTQSEEDKAEWLRLRREADDAKKALKQAQAEVYQYTVNCQTCVVANEARRRGYDVQATGNPENGRSENEKLARHSGLAWIDPETGGHPKEVAYDGKGREDALGRTIPTKASYWKWLNEDGRINVGERYTISFEWKGRARYGHIISMERTNDGIRFYDPQSGKSFVGEAAKEYAGKWKYQMKRYEWTYSTSPRIMRIDNLDFDYDFVDKILVKADE